ncbi:hypothetical protein TNCT_589131 [Trichonephila clavata]|uniref:Uncharacterized protein n=1 Tax=Trichonephila clavata TaxID=2740835 RepID=A0A8X6J1H2_TRICU|nr:hypothetical protein TNCT_589131 [Trichonephila clavata]
MATSLTDLTHAASWLWGYIKPQVYSNSPSSLVELNDAIRNEFSCIQPEMLHVAVDGVITRLRFVVKEDTQNKYASVVE